VAHAPDRPASPSDEPIPPPPGADGAKDTTSGRPPPPGADDVPDTSSGPPPPPGALDAPRHAAAPADLDSDEARELLTDEEQAVLDQSKAIPDGSDADLWAFAFDSSLRAQEALLASMRMVAKQQLTIEDAAIVTRVRGKVRITQTKDLNPAQGAVGGAWLGILAGLFLGPGGPLIGGALGAAAGGLFAKLRDIGIDDDEMKRMGEELADGEAALFLLVDDCHKMRALHEVSRFPGRVLASTADPEVVDEVRERLATDPWG
jgi:uncharacterized membrane protein